MIDFTYPSKDRVEVLREDIRDKIDELYKICESMGISGIYFVYAKSSLDTAIEKMESELYYSGIAYEEGWLNV